MGALHTLFEQGDAAIIGNVGPLIAPLTKADWDAQTVETPKRLFSHNDQQSTWASFQPEGAPFGWGGLIGDAVIAANANAEPVFTGISVSGGDIFLSGVETRPYRISTDGVQEIGIIDQDIVDLPPELLDLLRAHFESQGEVRQNLFERDVVDITVRSLAANDQFNDALLNAPGPINTVFPPSFLGTQLRAVAETINIRDLLGAKRQLFLVSAGGFDTHSGQASTLPVLQQDIADSIAAFFAATEEIGVSMDVTLFTASDFGRTLTVNGDGTDHGWGGHHFAVGGAVLGGDIYGEIPVPELEHDKDAGNGRLIPSVAVEQYAATLGTWFGLDQSELETAIPLLGNFPDGPLNFL
jgi:uncharacterized protein (DUF1501 family)